MTVGTLYSGGVDAFAYAAEMVGMQVKWQVEKNYEAHKYLKQNYPNAKRHFNDDKVGGRNLERVDIICSSDPCQPHSASGLRLGAADYRYRWPQCFRIIGELRPTWVINENVAGSVSNLVLDKKISDLESIGYTCRAYNIPAVAVGAHHERQRIFLVAHADVQGWRQPLHINPAKLFESCGQTIALGAQGNAFLQFEEREGEPPIFPVPHGIPDHIFRLGAVGDSIASPISIILLKAIQAIHNH